MAMIVMYALHDCNWYFYCKSLAASAWRMLVVNNTPIVLHGTLELKACWLAATSGAMSSI